MKNSIKFQKNTDLSYPNWSYYTETFPFINSSFWLIACDMHSARAPCSPNYFIIQRFSLFDPIRFLYFYHTPSILIFIPLIILFCVNFFFVSFAKQISQDNELNVLKIVLTYIYTVELMYEHSDEILFYVFFSLPRMSSMIKFTCYINLHKMNEWMSNVCRSKKLNHFNLYVIFHFCFLLAFIHSHTRWASNKKKQKNFIKWSTIYSIFSSLSSSCVLSLPCFSISKAKLIQKYTIICDFFYSKIRFVFGKSLEEKKQFEECVYSLFKSCDACKEC